MKKNSYILFVFLMIHCTIYSAELAPQAVYDTAPKRFGRVVASTELLNDSTKRFTFVDGTSIVINRGVMTWYDRNNKKVVDSEDGDENAKK